MGSIKPWYGWFNNITLIPSGLETVWSAMLNWSAKGKIKKICVESFAQKRYQGRLSINASM